MDRGKDGHTQYERDLKTDKDASIKMAFLQFKKFNIEPVKKVVKTELVQKLRNNLSKHTDKSGKAPHRDVREGKTEKSNFEDFRLTIH